LSFKAYNIKSPGFNFIPKLMKREHMYKMYSNVQKQLLLSIHHKLFLMYSIWENVLDIENFNLTNTLFYLLQKGVSKITDIMS